MTWLAWLLICAAALVAVVFVFHSWFRGGEVDDWSRALAELAIVLVAAVLLLVYLLAAFWLHRFL